MKHRLPSLDGLKVFEAAARHLSFSDAAVELCITKGAVSYQIRRLEEQLDCALFRRAVRQVYLTEAGQRLFKSTQLCFTELERTLLQIRPTDSADAVTIGVTTYVAMRWLSPRLSHYMAEHPEVSVLLHHWVSPEDFQLQDVDFAIRWCAMQVNADAKPLLQIPMPLYPVCSPALLERHGFAATTRDLASVTLSGASLGSTPLLCEARSFDLWPLWYGEQSQPLSNTRRVIDDANVRTQAAIDGQGWTMADSMMQREIDSGQLVAPFTHRLNGFGYAIQSAAGRHLQPNARYLRSWLVNRENETASASALSPQTGSSLSEEAI